MTGEVSVRLPVSTAALSDLLLVLLTFGAGAVDAISFLGLGRVFTANMTGNLVLLGLAAGQAAGSEAVRSAVSLVAFIAGVFLASRIRVGAPKPSTWHPSVKLVLGLEVLVQAGFLAGWLAASGRPDTALEAILVGVSALAMGMQTGAVRALGVAGVTTTYVTGTLSGLVGGIAAGEGSTRDWLRRGLVLGALLAGAACAGVLVLHARQVAPALPLASSSLVLGAAILLLPSSAG